MSGLRGVLFDYGGVMTTPVGDSIRAWILSDGIVPASFSRALKAWLGRDAAPGSPIHRLETGELSGPEFNELLAAELESAGREPIEAKDLLKRLFARMRPEPLMFELVADLRDAGIKVGLLSNSWGNSYPREQIEASFDAVVISGEVGLRKPDPSIYEYALDLLALPADAVAFVDDAEPNLIGAAAVGLRTHHHTDPLSTRAALATWVPSLILKEIS